MKKMKPILFSTPMVQAILQGRKTQTRRIVKKQPVIDQDSGYKFFDNLMFDIHDDVLESIYMPNHAPYKVGDILWVRETWRKANGMTTGYRYEWKATALEDGVPIDEPWRPSIFMPKEACRIFLKVKGVYVERINDISENDAIAEGVERFEGNITEYCYKSYLHRHILLYSPIDSYKSLWQKINGEKSWDENPFVWIYEFERQFPESNL